MKLRQVVLYFVIFFIGVSMGWYAVLFLQNQITLATIESVILTAIGAWLIVRLDLVKLFLAIRTQKKEDERRLKSAVYAQVEPLFTSFRRELALTQEAADMKDSVRYSGYLLEFQEPLKVYTPVRRRLEMRT